MKKLNLIIIGIAFLTSCNNSTQPEAISTEKMQAQSMTSGPSAGEKKAVVVEVVDGGTYTYIKLKEDNKEFWAAVSARTVVEGNKYFYTESVVMKNFESKHLGKTFDSIMFIDYFGEFPKKMMNANAKQASTGRTTTDKKGNVSIEHSGDEISLRDLFANKDEYKDELVIVKGEVVKISMSIMDRNWIHIQDGTNYEDEFDLTITTNEAVGFDLGDVITFKGRITLDKDFGAGYLYPVIMENASQVKKAE